MNVGSCGCVQVRNTINRLGMHGRWWINDPDCMLLREATSFTADEIIGTIHTSNHTLSKRSRHTGT